MYNLIKEKTDKLNEARKAYEQYDIELMTNAEYDALYDELEALEKETGIILENSPTQNVGYDIESNLPTEKHSKKMLSMNKTKDIDSLKKFMGDKKGYISWKIDGITIILTYDNGKFLKAVTRGDGVTGEIITETAMEFNKVPHEIPFKGKLVVRGEAHITYSGYEYIQNNIEEADAIYKNPRNLCSATVRQADPETARRRGVAFTAFSVIEAEGVDFGNSKYNKLNWLSIQGFETVERFFVDKHIVEQVVDEFYEGVKRYDVPADGVVFSFDDIAYSESLGETSKYPLDTIAYKWKDETATVKIESIEWNVSKHGYISPTVRFPAANIEGREISSAGMHNISVLEQLKIGIGDVVEVYLADMVVPQVIQNNTKSGNAAIPDICPVCGAKTEIKTEEGVKVLKCTNPACGGRACK